MKKVTIRELYDFYNNELTSSVKNKNALRVFEMNKMSFLRVALERINNPDYMIKRYNIFLIYEPKPRIIMSLNLIDKLINHYFTTTVLIPKIEPLLDNRNIATRKNLGTSYGIKLIRKYIEYYKKHHNGKFYVLKIDISKYFYNIDHEVLKKMIKKELEEDEYKRVCNIVDSTNFPYINKEIEKVRKFDPTLPIYKYGKGLGIGNLSSQTLSVYYLSRLDHFIIHTLRLKHYVRYMDDFLMLSDDKEKLEKAFIIIKEKLKKEYKLNINPKKSFVSRGDIGFTFLGYKFFISKKNNKTIMILKQDSYIRIKRNIKKVNSLYNNGKINYTRYFATISNYMYSYKGSVMKIRNYINRNF